MNNVILSGRITSDITPFYTEKGLCISKFSLAVRNPFRKSKITTEEQPAEHPKANCDFIDCVAFGRQAEILANFIHKGKRIFINGKLQPSSYINKEGKKIYKTEVVVNNFEYMENKDANGELVNVTPFSTLGEEDVVF